MALYSDFSIDAILGVKNSSRSEIKRKSSVSSVSDFSETEAEFEDHQEIYNPLELYVKSLALHQIQMAKMQLSPPAWAQRQQTRSFNSSEIKSRKYTKSQTAILLAKYSQRTYVSREEMHDLSLQTGLTMLQVKIWFQNRRLKDRKSTSKHGA